MGMVYEKVEFKEDYVLVTPEKAEELLKGNIQNRKIKPRVIKKYADIMGRGDWDIASTGVFIFIHDGQIRDGQHRLYAIVKSGVSMWCKIVTSSRKANIFDDGASRTTGDTMGYLGYSPEMSNSRITGYARFFLSCGAGTVSKTPDKLLIAEYIEQHFEMLDKAKTITEKSKGSDVKRGRSEAVGAAVYCALRCGISENVLTDFVQCFSKGRITDDNQTAAWVFRKMLLDMSYIISGEKETLRLFKAAQEAIYYFNKKAVRTQKYKCEFNEYSIKTIEMDRQESMPEVTVIKKDDKKAKFIPPTVEEVRAFCKERGNNVDAERFVAYYESNGWMVGKNKMKNWKAAVITWEKNDRKWA